MTLTLASKSAARRALLSGAGVVHEAVDSGVDEDVVKARMLAAGEGPAAIAQALADAKALAVSRNRPGLVIGADQTLDLEGELHDKAETTGQARNRLQALRGRTHALHSAVTLARAGQVIWSEVVTVRLAMRDFSDAFLDDYLKAEGEAALGSVGCYRLEGPGLQLFERLEGDYFTILGLPMMGLMDRLRQEGVLAA
jgi:septum formation protein